MGEGGADGKRAHVHLPDDLYLPEGSTQELSLGPVVDRADAKGEQMEELCKGGVHEEL